MDRKVDDSLQILPTCTSPRVKFSEESVNTWWCHLTEDGSLVNQNSPKEVYDGKIFNYALYSPEVATETGQRSPGLDMRTKSPFTLTSQMSLSSTLPGLSPFKDGMSTFRRQGLSGYSNMIYPFSMQDHSSPIADYSRTAYEPTSAYISPFVTSRRPPRLKIYPGALGSTPLRGLGQRYWEIEVTWDVKVHLYGLPIFEAGVAWGEAADTCGLVEGGGSSWVLRLTTCDEHPEYVCARALHGCRSLCHSRVRECRKNERFFIRYGFLVNFDTKELVIIDLSKKEVLYVFDNVDTSRDLWPVFGVFSRHRHHVKMRVLAGKDLNLDSTVTSVLSKMINRQPEPRPAKITSPANLKYSMFMQTT